MQLLKFISSALAVAGTIVQAAPAPNPTAKKPAKGTKYFLEPGRGEVTGHYDARYYKKIVGYEERLVTLHHLMASWLKTTQAEGIETWIAHGTLLGWWWNAKLLPWDFDIDVQVTEATLFTMGKKYNMTHWPYKSDDGKVEREYLLDVNPNSAERERGDGQNNIDARWIDKSTGLFIDITGLSETHPDTRPNIIVCKNYHRYHINEIFPLRDTLFEGIPAKIPYSYDKILIKEYKSKALTVTEYEGHRWNSEQKVWLPIPKTPVPANERAKPKAPVEDNQNRGLLGNLWRLIHFW